MLRPVDEHRIEHPRPGGEVLDVLVAAVLARGCGARGLAGHPVELLALERAEYRAVGKRGEASGGTRSGSVAIRSVSRFVHFASSSADGAVPISPGWWMPTYEHSGMCREVATSPVKSQITL
jgi:hypothetical protein